MSTRSLPVLVADGVSYQLPDGRPLLRELSLGVARERTGVVGANGTGKSTLLRLLAGELTPHAGAVRRAGRVGYLAQAREGGARRSAESPQPGAVPAPTLAHLLGVAERLSALQRVLGGGVDPADFDLVGDAWALPDRIAEQLARFGLGHLATDRPVATLSGGEVTRAALVRLVLDAPDVVLLDEPTNHLDRDGRAAVLRFVAEWTGGLVVASHDRALLARVDRTLELSALGARLYGGGWDDYRAQRDAEDAAAHHALDHARQALRRTERQVQATRERQQRRDAQGRRDRATANQSRLLLNLQRERSQATGARLTERAERLVHDQRERLAEARTRVEVRERVALRLPPTGLRADQLVVAVEQATFAHAGAAAPVLRDVSLLVRGPERVALAGANGSGKTTLLRLLAGTLAPQSGRVRHGVSRGEIAYLDQHAARLHPAWTVAENARAAHPTLDEEARRHLLAQLRFRGGAADAPVHTLSGGERLRAALACALNLVHPPRLLLLDEPSNHLDLESLEAVEAALRGYDGALVVVSHDEAFLGEIGVERRIEVGDQAPGCACTLPHITSPATAPPPAPSSPRCSPADRSPPAPATPSRARPAPAR